MQLDTRAPMRVLHISAVSLLVEILKITPGMSSYISQPSFRLLRKTTETHQIPLNSDRAVILAESIIVTCFSRKHRTAIVSAEKIAQKGSWICQGQEQGTDFVESTSQPLFAPMIHSNL